MLDQVTPSRAQVVKLKTASTESLTLSTRSRSARQWSTSSIARKRSLSATKHLIAVSGSWLKRFEASLYTRKSVNPICKLSFSRLLCPSCCWQIEKCRFGTRTKLSLCGSKSTILITGTSSAQMKISSKPFATFAPRAKSKSPTTWPDF